MLNIFPINLVCYKVDYFTILKAPNPTDQPAHLEEETNDF